MHRTRPTAPTAALAILMMLCHPALGRGQLPDTAVAPADGGVPGAVAPADGGVPGAVAPADGGVPGAVAPADGGVPWRPLFDGTGLDGWRATSFGGEGEVEIVGDAIRIGMGADLSGITWEGDFPRQSYELALEARRVEGNDFFCGLTFPVGDSFCSLILGGWGGAVTGLSSIDGLDAAHNDTTLVRDYTARRWYAVTLRVTPEEIECFVDGEPIIEQPLEGRRLSIRDEVIPSRPLGIATYATTAEVRRLRWRPLGEPASGEGAAPGSAKP